MTRALLLTVTLLLTGCAGTATTASEPPAGSGAEVTDPCPRELPQAAGTDGFGTREPAPGPPDLPAADQAWVCQYAAATGAPGAGEDGSLVTWRLRGDAVAVPDDEVEGLTAPLAGLEPQDADLCTEDLGPRWLLVTSTDGELTGVAFDDFGCQHVRFTDDPAQTEPGEGSWPGALVAPESLLEQVRAAHRG